MKLCVCRNADLALCRDINCSWSLHLRWRRIIALFILSWWILFWLRCSPFYTCATRRIDTVVSSSSSVVFSSGRLVCTTVSQKSSPKIIGIANYSHKKQLAQTFKVTSSTARLIDLRVSTDTCLHPVCMLKGLMESNPITSYGKHLFVQSSQLHAYQRLTKFLSVSSAGSSRWYRPYNSDFNVDKRCHSI